MDAVMNIFGSALLVAIAVALLVGFVLSISNAIRESREAKRKVEVSREHR